MTNSITPPPELVEQWIKECDNPEEPRWQEYEQDIATLAARWGADQELEACCEWLDEGFGDVGNFPAILRTARRPKPPSLKEQALKVILAEETSGNLHPEKAYTIRRALEQLDD